MGTALTRGRPMPRRIRTLQVILLLLVSIITYGALILPLALSPASLPLQPGDVAPNDFQAQDSLDYISEVRTEEERVRAEKAVAPIYSSPEPSIARGQLGRLDRKSTRLNSSHLVI